MTLANAGESDLPACDPPASFSVHLASSGTHSGEVCPSNPGVDNVVAYVGAFEELKR